MENEFKQGLYSNEKKKRMQEKALKMKKDQEERLIENSIKLDDYLTKNPNRPITQIVKETGIPYRAVNDLIKNGKYKVVVYEYVDKKFEKEPVEEKIRRAIAARKKREKENLEIEKMIGNKEVELTNNEAIKNNSQLVTDLIDKYGDIFNSNNGNER